jgi:hypothetical protein
MWLTTDIEEVTDMNFNVLWKKTPQINYEKYIDYFLEIAQNKKSTAFVLGSFAKKYPDIVKKIANSGVEIASHSMYHKIVYQESFKEWKNEIREAKKILEDLIGKEVVGYRSPSWTLPFDKKYYAELALAGYKYSSSYFPMKNYMYGNSINKLEPFKIYTENGIIEERPIPKNIIPFGGGFYLRVLPLWLLKSLFKKTKQSVLYIHPYELIDENLIKYFWDDADKNLDYFLAFIHLGYAKDKIKRIVDEIYS